MSCPQISNVEQEKDSRPVKLNEKKKQRRHIFGGRTTGKFYTGGDKMRNASGHQCKVKMSSSEREHVRHFLHKRVTKKFLEVSSCSRAKQRQRNVQKYCAARAKLLLLIRPILLFFTFFRRCMPSPLSITRFYNLFEQTI